MDFETLEKIFCFNVYPMEQPSSIFIKFSCLQKLNRSVYFAAKAFNQIYFKTDGVYIASTIYCIMQGQEKRDENVSDVRLFSGQVRNVYGPPP